MDGSGADGTIVFGPKLQFRFRMESLISAVESPYFPMHAY